MLFFGLFTKSCFPMLNTHCSGRGGGLFISVYKSFGNSRFDLSYSVRLPFFQIEIQHIPDTTKFGSTLCYVCIQNHSISVCALYISIHIELKHQKSFGKSHTGCVHAIKWKIGKWLLYPLIIMHTESCTLHAFNVTIFFALLSLLLIFLPSMQGMLSWSFDLL